MDYEDYETTDDEAGAESENETEGGKQEEQATPETSPSLTPEVKDEAEEVLVASMKGLATKDDKSTAG